MTSSGIPLGAQITFEEAHKRLSEFDVLIVPGGNVLKLLKDEEEPLDLIQAYAKLQAKDSSRERTLLGIDTAALLFAKMGVLQGLAATTHPDYNIKLNNICQEAASNDSQERTDVMEERYVVNNARFDLEINEDGEENPYVFRKGRRSASGTSGARRGSMLRKMSNARRESIIKRSEKKLGGLRVITTNGPASGVDATLYLVSALVSHESAQEASRLMRYDWIKGVVVDSIDV